MNRPARRKLSVSALVAELVQQEHPVRLPYAGLIDDVDQLSRSVEEILTWVGT